MLFLPMPHEVQEKPCEFQIRWNTSVILSERTAPGALLWARMLRQEILDSAGLDLHTSEPPKGFEKHMFLGPSTEFLTH